MKRSLFIFSLLVTVLSCRSQKEAAQWHFGYRGQMNFQNGTPVALNTSSIFTQFSSASIADQAGNLLFYMRSGDLIYNKNNDTMANGFNMGGAYQGAQSGIIIPKQGTEYYVIVTHYLNLFTQPQVPPIINYAIVDMQLAGGMGSVTVSNVPISPAGVPMMSRLAATKHCNQKDYWILTHAGGHNLPSNQYYAYHVTSSGIVPNPVITAIGSSDIANTYLAPGHDRSQHKFSPNGKRVAATLKYRTVELYEFDNSTGVLSNVIKLDTITNPPQSYSGEPGAHGLEFSPDGSKLYVSYIGNHPMICQFDLLAGSPAAIAASKMAVTALTNTSVAALAGHHSLQLAPDGKIYVAAGSSTVLGVINNPNASAALCNYQPQAITLSIQNKANSAGALPNFISSYFEEKPVVAVAAVGNCGSTSFTAPVLHAAAGYSVSGYHWSFGDAGTSQLANPSHTYAANGNYTVQMVLQYLPCGADTLQQVINISNLPVLNVTGKTTICQGEKAVLSFGGAASYSLNSAPVVPSTTLQLNTSKVYTLTATDVNGCYAAKKFTVSVVSCAGVSEQAQAGQVKIYPNPGTGIFIAEVSGPVFITVIDPSGRTVLDKKLDQGDKQIDLRSFANGIYFLKFSPEGKPHVIKLVKIASQ